MYTVVTSLYIPPKCAKTREPEDEHCVLQYTCISYNIHNPISLNNKSHTALPYINSRSQVDFSEQILKRFFGKSLVPTTFKESIFVMVKVLASETRTCLCIYHIGHFYNRNTMEIETFSNTMIYLVH